METKEITKAFHKDENTTLTNSTESKNNKKRKRKEKEHSNEIESKKIKTNDTVNNKIVKDIKNVQQNAVEKAEINLKIDKEHVEKTVSNVKTVFNKFNSNKKHNIQKTDKSKMGRKKFKKNKKNEPNSQIAAMNASRLKMYGINAKKLKNKLKYGKQKL